MTTFVFPGQGSQKKGMGGSLFDEFPDFTQKADKILGYSIKNLCLEDQEGKLTKTEFTQPALFVVNALSYLKKNKKPNFAAGHSLGEYNALFAANVFDFETGLKLVQKRGELMGQARDGAMAAIIGLKSPEVQAILQQNNLTNVNISNYNTYTQSVVSGPREDVIQAQPIFEKGGAMVIPLKVSGAFHSSLMQQAQNTFAEFIKQFNFSTPEFPVIANVNAKPYQQNDTQNNLAQQITHPVMWTQSIEYLLKQNEKEFEEIGDSKILSGMIQRIQKGQ
jgi:trans-AT polyketide synthase/acyltransferase/oxidoreductase domain-containing protein